MWEKYSHVIPHIAVDSGVINNITGWVLSGKYKSLLVVSDPYTYRVAGERVAGLLTDAGITVSELCFPSEEPVPDEQSIGFLTAAYTADIDLILGVGSGTINDVCTYVSSKGGCPSAIVATAPSMDGYASLGSAMLLEGVKVTPPTQCPVAIFCDLDILTQAPLHMLAAGLGDMLGKITALADWRLAHLLAGEPMPEDIVSIVKDALDRVTEGAPRLTGRDPSVIKSITGGLILSGIAMSLYKDSRPASGTEHHLAHFWEMRMIAEGKKPALHGLKVGLATITGLVMWKELAKVLPAINSNSKVNKTPRSDYEKDIHRLYGRSAASVLKTQNPDYPLEYIIKNRNAILKIADSLPEPEVVTKLLSDVSAPVFPSEINLSNETLRESIVYSRDRKKVYTLLQLLGDIGCLEDFAERVKQYFANKALAGVKCFVLDMDGTVYLSDRVFPYTEKFLKHINDSGMDYIFYTNNSSQNTAYYLNKLNNMGIPVTKDKLFISTHVLLSFLEKNRENQSPVVSGMNVFVAGTKALRDDFAAAGYILTDSNPDFAVLGFDRDMDYKRLTLLCDFVRAGVPYYGVHIDYNCPVSGGFIPDCGSLAAAVTASTGVTPEFFGKPSRYTLDYIIKKTGYRENELCFVGDRLYTDIAIASGTKARSVLVLSGETGLSDLQDSEFVPDITVNDLSALMTYL